MKLRKGLALGIQSDYISITDAAGIAAVGYNGYMPDQTREKNSFWKGGRTVASTGYMLVKVGVGHHLADVRGYAYEHRIVAESKLGRRLLPGEQVHHVDGNKLNNDPLNLEVVESIAHHRLIERRIKMGNRKPGEGNPEVRCACGCATYFPKFDRAGRPRKFVTGHNGRKGA